MYVFDSDQAHNDFNKIMVTTIVVIILIWATGLCVLLLNLSDTYTFMMIIFSVICYYYHGSSYDLLLLLLLHLFFGSFASLSEMFSCPPFTAEVFSRSSKRLRDRKTPRVSHDIFDTTKQQQQQQAPTVSQRRN